MSDPDMEPVDYYKVSKLAKAAEGEQGSISAPWVLLLTYNNQIQLRFVVPVLTEKVTTKINVDIWGRGMQMKALYHALLKDDKLQTEDINNPLNDSKKAMDLFFNEVTAFQLTDNRLKQIFYALLNDHKYIILQRLRLRDACGIILQKGNVD